MRFCKRKGVECEYLTDHSVCNSNNCHRDLPDVNNLENKEKQIEETAKNRQWQRRDSYCLRIQKAFQYRGTSDNEDLPSILVDFENEIRKEIPLEDSIVLSREEYEKLKLDLAIEKKRADESYTQKEVEEIIASKERIKSKETAEKILKFLKEHLSCMGFSIVKAYFKEQFGVEIKE